MTTTQQDRDSTDSWFNGAGLGVFIHWDHASQQGIEISWAIFGGQFLSDDEVVDPISVTQYTSSAATFDPQNWDARELARTIKQTGATYAVFTARHHTGYSMFFSDCSDFSVQNSPVHRDLTRELIEALRAEGLRIGLYYSLSDWHHPDYPAFTDADRVAPGSPLMADPNRRSSAEAWERYRGYLRGQLTELLTNYGRIDLLWFDGEWERTAEEWDTAGLRTLIKGIQPDIIINDRLLGQGDYVTPEQGFANEPIDGPWELCMTMGRLWSYNPADVQLKSSRVLARTLVEVVSRGGNLLLNIGPDGDGVVPEPHLERMRDLGAWMQTHRESVIGVVPGLGVDFYGPVTRTDSTIYLHLVMLPVDELVVRRVPVAHVRGVRLLGGHALAFTANVEAHEKTERGEDAYGELRIAAPEPSGALIDVVAIDLG